MALNNLKCKYLMPLHFKGLKSVHRFKDTQIHTLLYIILQQIWHEEILQLQQYQI